MKNQASLPSSVEPTVKDTKMSEEPIVFSILAVSPERIEGYAYCRFDTAPVTVTLLVGGKAVAEQTARHYVGSAAAIPAGNQFSGFYFENTSYFSGNAYEKVDFSFRLSSSSYIAKTSTFTASRFSAFFHYFINVHLPSWQDQLSRIKGSLIKLNTRILSGNDSFHFPEAVLQPLIADFSPFIPVNSYFHSKHLLKGGGEHTLFDEQEYFSDLFIELQKSTILGMNYFPIDDELVKYCTDIVKYIDGVFPLSRILENYASIYHPDDMLHDEISYGNLVSKFIDKIALDFSTRDKLIGHEVSAFLKQKHQEYQGSFLEVPNICVYMWNKSPDLKSVFQIDDASSAFSLVLDVSIRLASDGLSSLISDDAIRILTHKVSIFQDGDTVLDALCRLCGVPRLEEAGIARQSSVRPSTVYALAPLEQRLATSLGEDMPHVRVFGLLQSNGGLRNNLDNSVAALTMAGFSVDVLDIQSVRLGGADLNADPALNIFHVPPPQLPECFITRSPNIFKYSYNIGFLMWETQKVPDSFLIGIRMLDEIWTGSNFSATAFRKVFSAPVVNMLHAVEPANLTARRSRQDFGINKDAFCFYFAFDAKGLFSRKNPFHTILAFQKAFPGSENVRLIIKIRNTADAWNDSRNVPYWRALKARAAKDKRIHLITRDFSEQEMWSMMTLADCYVSLHRAEGFGYTIAEAMLCGKPVIASRYSGNLDFTHDDNAFLVDGREVYIAGSEGFGDAGSKWFEPDLAEAARMMRHVYENPDLAKEIALNGQLSASGQLSLEQLAKRYRTRLLELKSKACSILREASL